MGRRPTKNMNLPPRMRARIQRSGRIYYYYDTGSKPRKEIPLGDDYPLAVRKWSEIEIDSKKLHVELITFRYAATLYMRDVLPKKAPRTQKDNLTELEYLFQFFDNPPAPLDEIKPCHISQYMKWRVRKAQTHLHEQNVLRLKLKRPVKQTTGREGEVRANRERALFSHIFNFARQSGLTDHANPCQGVTGFEEHGRSDVYIDDDIFKMVWDEADLPLRDAMDLAYLTGQRPADVLKTSETDIKDGELAIKQNKRGKKLRIKIIGELQALLERINQRKLLHKIRSLALIVNESGDKLSYGALDDRFEKARNAAIRKAPDNEVAEQIKQFQFRDLRAKAGTDKEDAEGLESAQHQLGHEDSKMTRHYVRNRKGKLVNPTK